MCVMTPNSHFAPEPANQPTSQSDRQTATMMIFWSGGRPRKVGLAQA